MNKTCPEWFKFFYIDWLTDDAVISMTPEQRGAFIHLLCFQVKNNGLPDDDTVLAALSGMGNDRWKIAGGPVRERFVKRGEKLFNKKLLSVLKKYENILEARRLAGVASGKSRFKANKTVNICSTHVEQNGNDLELELELEKNLKTYIVVFDFWNSKKHVTQHRKFAGATKDRIIKAINGRITEGYSEQDILSAIDNYDFVVGSQLHFFNYKWPLDIFLSRSNGFPAFTDSADPRHNFLSDKTPSKPVEIDRNTDRSIIYR